MSLVEGRQSTDRLVEDRRVGLRQENAGGVPELYPFELEVSLHGVAVETFRLADPDQGGRHVIAAAVPPLDSSELALEVMLETRSYWATIRDPRMKSFYLVSARVD